MKIIGNNFYKSSAQKFEQYLSYYIFHTKRLQEKVTFNSQLIIELCNDFAKLFIKANIRV